MIMAACKNILLLLFYGLTATAGYSIVKNPSEKASMINVFTGTTAFLPGEYDVYTCATEGIDYNDILHAPDSCFVSLENHKKFITPAKPYWLRVKIDNRSDKNPIIGFTTHRYLIDFYYPDSTGKYHVKKTAYKDVLYKRDYYTADNYLIVPYQKGVQTYLVKLYSKVFTGMGFAIMSPEHAHNKSVVNTAFHFLFVGIMLFVVLLNSLVYLRLKEKLYLYYVCYVISITVFAASIWGYLSFILDFEMNEMYAESLPYSFATLFLLYYTKDFLRLNERMPLYSHLITGAVIVKIITYGLGLLLKNSYWHQAYFDALCLFPALLSGFVSYIRGFKPARFFSLSLTVLYMGFFFHATFEIWLEDIIMKLPYFSMYLSGYTHFFFFSALAEVILFTIALAERFNNDKKQLLLEQKNALEANVQLMEKQKEVIKLKEELNYELETLVRMRTAELEQANQLLKVQSEKLAILNDFLEEDNRKLQLNIEELKQAQLLKPDASFNDFEKIFKDNDTCLSFIANVKWQRGYTCAKCGYKKYHAGKKNFSRKCKACGYDDSATAHTLLEGVKFPFNKALYIIYIKFFNKNVKIAQVANEISLREATAYTFSKKVDETVAKSRISLASWIDVISVEVD